MVKYAGAGGVGAAVLHLLDKFAVLMLSSACINVRDLIVIPSQFCAMKCQTVRKRAVPPDLQSRRKMQEFMLG